MDEQQNEFQPSEVNTESVSKNKSHVKVVATAGVFLAFGLLGGYYLGTAAHTQIPATAPSVSQNSSPTAMLTKKEGAGAIPLADAWSTPLTTYADPDINITFDYPKAYIIQKDDFDSEFTIWVASPHIDNDDQNVKESSKYSLSVPIAIIKNPEHKPLLDVIKEKYNHHAGLPRLLQNLTSMNAPTPNSYMFKGALTDTQIKKVFFANKDLVYELTLFGGLDAGTKYSPEQEQFFDKLISTIKLNK
jgi:hypothetical protein